MNRREEELIQDYADGRVDENREADVRQLLARDPEACEFFQTLRALRQQAAPDRDFRIAVGRLIGRFVDDLKNRREGGPNRGLLTFDSGFLPLPAGIRPATVDSRRLRYAADALELELSMYPASRETYEIIGQVTGFDQGEILEVELASRQRVLREQSNPFQVFHFVRVPEGAYTLTVVGPEEARFEFGVEV